MKKRTIALIATGMALAGSGCTAARRLESQPLQTSVSTDPNRSRHKWERVERLDSGTTVRVVLSDGSRVEGQLIEAGPDSVRVDLGPRPAPQASTIRIVREDVRTLEQRRRDHKGMAIGTLVGAVAGVFIIGKLHGQMDSRPTSVDLREEERPVRKDREPTGDYAAHVTPGIVGMVGVITGIGTGAGALVDLARKPGFEIVYVRP